MLQKRSIRHGIAEVAGAIEAALPVPQLRVDTSRFWQHSFSGRRQETHGR
jgi:hypothetical protein